MNNDIQQSSNEDSNSDDSAYKTVLKTVREREAMQEKIHNAGKPLFDKIKDEYHEKLMLAIQTHRAKYDEEMTAKFGCRDEWEKQDAIVDSGNGHRCHVCGAHERYSKKQKDRSEWLGVGEIEDCMCGAEYEHHRSERKKPVNEQSLLTLLETARRVEMAYVDANLTMTYEQISMNRSYFRRIINAIDGAKHNHFLDRFLQCLEYRRFSERYYEMLDLMEKVDGGGVARAYMKYGDHPRELSGLDEMVSELELELAAKTILST